MKGLGHMQHKQSGFLLIAAIILVAIFGAVGVMVAHLVTNELHASTEQAEASEAFYVANSGLEVGLLAVTHPNAASRVDCADLAASYTNVSLGNGVYSLTGVKYAPTTQITLTSAVTDSSTVLPVSSLTGLAPYGEVIIDQELIMYGGTSTSDAVCGSAPCLVNLTRGIGVTTAAAHVVSSAVSQNQCSITAVGGVPNLTSPRAKRTLTANALQLEEGWAVGNTTAGGETIGFWNGRSWAKLPEDSNLPNNRIKAIAALSYSDIWVVGNSGLFFHWNGAQWQAGNIQTSGQYKVSNDHFNDLHCNNTSDCWAVGDKSASDAFMARWDGTIWSGAAVGLVNENLYGVSCLNSNDCWAVGNNSTFLHWNGTAWSLGTLDGAMPILQFNAVSCSASDDCWAVGDNGTLAHYDGTSWSEYSAASLPATRLTNIDCTSSDNCWLVGHHSTYPLIAHWDGSAWQRESAANLSGAPDVDLFGISCAKPDNCWASGASGTMLHYDGSSWSNSTSNSLPSTDINDVNLIASEDPQIVGFWQQE